MAIAPLAVSADLSAFPGAPFEDALVNAACASIRSEAGWHIAPVVTETLQLDSYGGYLLPLPTRRIVNVTAVRGPDGASITGWFRLTGGLYRDRYTRWFGWPIGVIEVDLTHGYDRTPLDLLPVIVQRIKSASIASNITHRAVTVDRVSTVEAYNVNIPTTDDPVVARYAVPGGVA